MSSSRSHQVIITPEAVDNSPPIAEDAPSPSIPALDLPFAPEEHTTSNPTTLNTGGQYDHNLTYLVLVCQDFLQAGGLGNEDYHFLHRSIKQELDRVLLETPSYQQPKDTNHWWTVRPQLSLAI